jgi:hypothetical protein
MVESFLPDESRDFLDEIEDEADRRIFSGERSNAEGHETCDHPGSSIPL